MSLGFPRRSTPLMDISAANRPGETDKIVRRTACRHLVPPQVRGSELGQEAPEPPSVTADCPFGGSQTAWWNQLWPLWREPHV